MINTGGGRIDFGVSCVVFDCPCLKVMLAIDVYVIVISDWIVIVGGKSFIAVWCHK